MRTLDVDAYSFDDNMFVAAIIPAVTNPDALTIQEIIDRSNDNYSFRFVPMIGMEEPTDETLLSTDMAGVLRDFVQHQQVCEQCRAKQLVMRRVNTPEERRAWAEKYPAEVSDAFIRMIEAMTELVLQMTVGALSQAKRPAETITAPQA